MTLTGKTRLKIWLVLLGVFVLGSVTGAALDGVYRTRARSDRRDEHGGGHEREARFETMRRELKLTDEQATQVRAILEETRNEYRALRNELRPRFEAPRLKARERMRAILTPEQQQIFDAKTAERDSKHEGREAQDGFRH